MAIVGVDEAGRGSLAGPVVAAAVILDEARPILGLDDSKKLSSSVREMLYEQIYARAVFVSIKAIDAVVIDQVNILQATFLAMRHVVVEALGHTEVDLVIVDGKQKIPDVTVRQMAIVGGDGLIECIMAASIVAKVYRDNLMKELDRAYPHYGFVRHKGYGTKEHLLAIKSLGPSAIHRLSYAPLRDRR